MSELESIKEEVNLQRDRYHKLSSIVNVVTGNIEMMKDSVDRMAALTTEVSVLSSKVNLWMETTTEYRTSLCEKINRLLDKFEELPCKERGEMYKGIGVTQKLMWTAIGVTFGIIAVHLGWK